MPTDREQLKAAKHLIQTKQYRKARRILKHVDHPTADKWLDQLDQIAPESRRPSIGALLAYLALALVGCVLASVIVWALPPLQAVRAEMALTYHCAFSNIDNTDGQAACEAQIETVPRADLVACWGQEGGTDMVDAGWRVAQCLNDRLDASF